MSPYYFFVRIEQNHRIVTKVKWYHYFQLITSHLKVIANSFHKEVNWAQFCTWFSRLTYTNNWRYGYSNIFWAYGIIRLTYKFKFCITKATKQFIQNTSLAKKIETQSKRNQITITTQECITVRLCSTGKLILFSTLFLSFTKRPNSKEIERPKNKFTIFLKISATSNEADPVHKFCW